VTRIVSHSPARHRWMLGTLLGLALAVCGAGPAGAMVTLSAVSEDPYTNTDSQHRTQVEPDTFASGNTIVAAFQSGRFTDGGASNVGWATSTDAGATWTAGFLPGTTRFAGGSYARVSDPSVAYDARHGVWLIITLPLGSPGGVLISRSTDGALTWGNPVPVVATGDGLDKPWVACDDTATSPHYGNCYATWDDNADGDRLKVSTSSDGGQTWGAVKETADHQFGLGGQPVVQPGGTVIVPAADGFETSILAFSSSDGGASWSATTTVATADAHPVAGGLRTGPLPSAEVAADGTVYVAWQDCRFRTGCAVNDIVFSTSTDGTTWSTPARVPIDGLSTPTDHFIPGLAVDPATSGTGTHLALTYYYLPEGNCTLATCRLDVGFVSSADSGASWSVPDQVAGPMSLGWLPPTTQGLMVGDYISTSFVAGNPRSVVAVANPKCGATFDEGMYTWTGSGGPIHQPAPPPCPSSPGASGSAPAAPAALRPPAGSPSTVTPAPAATQGKAIALLGGLGVVPQRFRVGSARASITARAGTFLVYRLREDARVRFTVSRARRGRMRGGRCFVHPPRPTAGARRCTRYVRVRGHFATTGRSGGHRLRFTGRLEGRALAPGRYRLDAIATPLAHASGGTAHTGFVVMAPRRQRAPVRSR